MAQDENKTYQVTATRKRPKSFETLIGQEFVVSTLENALKEGKIAHAYLFSGPRGVGKTSSARLLAKALNCEKGISAHPCGVCNNCISIAEGRSVDVIEIDGASNNGVDAVRAIKEEVTFPPQTSRYKIYIIDEVHMLSISAFNALLKTIEEPPEYVIFIFATTELQKVPQTIRSRCQQFHFQLISEENIVKCLKSAAEDIYIEADEDALYWIAKEGKGSMRDSYTLFDQVASFSEGHITLEKIREKLGGAESQSLIDILSHSFSGDAKSSLEELDALFLKGIGENQIIKDLSEFCRSLLFYKEGIRRRELLSFPEEDLKDERLEGYTKEMLELILKSLFSLYRDIRYSISPRFELELFISRLSSIRFITDPADMMKKIEEIRKGIESGNVEIKRSYVPVPAPRGSYGKTEEKKTEKSPMEDVTRPFSTDELLKRIREDKESFLATTLSKCDITERDGKLVIVAKSDMAFDAVSEKRNAIVKALSEIKSPLTVSIGKVQVEKTRKKAYSENVARILQVFKQAEVYEIKERKEDEHKPVRNDETAGITGEPDEQDEGGGKDS